MIIDATDYRGIFEIMDTFMSDVFFRTFTLSESTYLLYLN